MRLVCATATVLAFAAPAAAQDIVVTANRQDLMGGFNAPASSASLSGADLTFIAPQTASEALNRLAGVAIQRNNGVENLIAMRSPVLTGGQSAGSFLVLDDGVPIRAPGFANVNQLWETSLDFASQVDVTRGPGSSLYGSNAVHGVVNVQTSTGIADTEACARAGGGVSADTLGRADLQATFRWGVRQPHAAQCSGAQGVRGVAGVAVSEDRGWRDASGVDRQALLLSIGHGTHHQGFELEGRLLVQNLNQESAGFIEGPQAFRSRALSRSNPVPEAYRDTRLARAQLAATWRGEAVDVRLTPFARLIEADLNLFFFPSRAQEITRQAGGGLLASMSYQPTDDMGLIVGLDVDQTRGELTEIQARPTIGSFTQGVHYDYVVDMTVGGLYAQAQWAPRRHWRLTAGARAESVRYAYDNRAQDGDVGRFRRPADRADTFDAISPRINLSWAPHADGIVWINLTRGLRAPQITDLYSLQTRQNPGEQSLETTDAAELGARWRTGGARLEAVAYTMDKQDTSFRGADGFTVTGGRTRHAGLELSGEAALGEAWSAAGWISLSAQTYRFDSPADAIRSGAAIDTAPERLGNLRLRWTRPEMVQAELEWSHVGPSFTDAANTRTYRGHDVFALRAALVLSEGVALSAAIRNLTNTDYADRADFAFGAERYFPGAPRSLTVGLWLAR